MMNTAKIEKTWKLIKLLASLSFCLILCASCAESTRNLSLQKDETLAVAYAVQGGSNLGQRPMVANTDHIPGVFNIVLDASSSVSRKDFQTANQSVAEFAELLFERSTVHTGEKADWLSVNWFGGRKDFIPTHFINCSDVLKMGVLRSFLNAVEHPRFNHTAIYDSIAKGAAHILAKDNELPGFYFRSLIVVTDGEDNNSVTQIKNNVKRVFPNDKIQLIVVGVGDEAHVSEFKGVADQVFKIDNFGELSAALMVSLEMASALSQSSDGEAYVPVGKIR